MRNATLLAGFLLLAFSTGAQVSGGGKPFSFTYALTDNFAKTKITMPALDVRALQRQAREIHSKGEMLPAGKIFPVSLSMENSGEWTVLPNEDRVWRLFIEVPGAPATSLYFDDFYIPEGGLLYVYNAEKTHLIGSFGAHNNSESKQFATEIVYTGDCVIEYYEKANVKKHGSFTITGIANIYNAPEPPPYIHLKVGPPGFGFGTAGACNVNVNCPEGSTWVNQRNSVARILIKNNNVQGWCSGALVNNTQGDCKNYLLTANHCGAATSATDKNQWIFYFNYQSEGCSNPGSEPIGNTITGCRIRSSSSNGTSSVITGSDFLLVELNGSIPISYNVYYAGVDAGGAGSSAGVGIHHPMGDIKKISTYNSPLISSAYSNINNAHWKVHWVPATTNYGITEPGSSGSPLFNPIGRIVGKLSGGPSSCGNADDQKNDYYGKLSYDWTASGSLVSQQLRPWLDPFNTGITSIAGKTPCSTACPDFQEPNNTIATAASINPGATYKALIATGSDIDYYKFTVSAGTTITVSLTTLPLDYDVQLINPSGVVVASSTNGGNANESIIYTSPVTGIYSVKVYGFNGAFSASLCYTLVVFAQTPCVNTPEPNESLAAAVSISAFADIYSQIGSAPDVDWYKLNNAAVAPHIFLTLNNLPGDYDLFLFNAAGTMLASSTWGGTNSEEIIYNTNTVSTYYIRVNGYNGANSTTTCYRLRAEINGIPKAAWGQSTVARGDINSVTVFPNPARAKLNISYTAAESRAEQATITDITGKKVLINTINSIPGKNDHGIILPSHLAKGIYFLQIGTRTPVKFVKG